MRPGMNEVSKNPLRRSTMPLDSGSLRLAAAPSWWPASPRTPRRPRRSRCPRPMPGSLSQISRRGTRPSCWISSHDPSSRSAVFRVGIIRPVMNRECAADDHQHRQQLGGAVLERDLAAAGTTDRTAPRRPAPTSAGRPDRSAGAPAADRVTFSRNHADRPRPAHPLGQHRRRHVRGLRQQRPHPRLERRERRRPRRPLIPRRRRPSSPP